MCGIYGNMGGARFSSASAVTIGHSNTKLPIKCGSLTAKAQVGVEHRVTQLAQRSSIVRQDRQSNMPGLHKASLSGLGLCWDGFKVKRSAVSVHGDQMKSYRVWQLRVLTTAIVVGVDEVCGVTSQLIVTVIRGNVSRWYR